jgi:Fe-S-cluster containining protein
VPNATPEVDQPLYQLTYRSTRGFIQEGGGPDLLPVLGEGLLELADEFTNRYAREWRLDEPACRAGCSHCCTLRVDVTVAELAHLLDVIRSEWAPDAVQALRDRIEVVWHRRESLPVRARREARVPCPLLVDGHCSVYAARPLACRAWHAFDADACRADAAAPNTRDIAYNPHRLGIAHSVALGAAAALREAGVAPSHVDLLTGLRAGLAS